MPDKVCEKPIVCPVCNQDFMPDAFATKKQNAKNNKQKNKTSRPSMRAIPVPASVEKELSSPVSSSLDPPKTRLAAPGPPSPPSKYKSTSRKKEKQRDLKQTTDSKNLSPKKTSQQTARIIKTESVQPQLTVDGKLPTLQLKDDVKPKHEEDSITRNPAFIGVLVCVSLLLSVLMLLIAQPPKDKARQAVENARSAIKKFYSVRIDENPQPYQLDLRQAQLAHSRGDFIAETQAYQRVMLRFRAEDDGKPFKVTGSKDWDTELHDLVSTLLNEAKRLSK
ncbi:MAG: hypothetical protein AAF939_19960 [Planctomycetota bacterium]